MARFRFLVLFHIVSYFHVFFMQLRKIENAFLRVNGQCKYVSCNYNNTVFDSELLLELVISIFVHLARVGGPCVNFGPLS